MEKKIEEYTQIELESIAYRSIKTIELHQRNLQAINAELLKRESLNDQTPEAKIE